MNESDLDFDPELDHQHESEDDPDECGPPVHHDEVDEALESFIDMLVQAGYADESAEDAVYLALEALIESEQLPDTPDMDVIVESKHAWVANARPLVCQKLRSMGLEFD